MNLWTRRSQTGSLRCTFKYRIQNGNRYCLQVHNGQPGSEYVRYFSNVISSNPHSSPKREVLLQYLFYRQVCHYRRSLSKASKHQSQFSNPGLPDSKTQAFSYVVVVQLLSCVQLFATPQATARQASSASGVCSNSCPLSQ